MSFSWPFSPIRPLGNPLDKNKTMSPSWPFFEWHKQIICFITFKSVKMMWDKTKVCFVFFSSVILVRKLKAKWGKFFNKQRKITEKITTYTLHHWNRWCNKCSLLEHPMAHRKKFQTRYVVTRYLCHRFQYR